MKSTSVFKVFIFLFSVAAFSCNSYLDYIYDNSNVDSIILEAKRRVVKYDSVYLDSLDTTIEVGYNGLGVAVLLSSDLSPNAFDYTRCVDVFNDFGQPVLKQIINSKKEAMERYFYEYNEFGLLEVEQGFSPHVLDKRLVYKYDKNKNIAQLIEYRWGSIYRKTKYKYNEKQELVKKVEIRNGMRTVTDYETHPDNSAHSP